MLNLGLVNQTHIVLTSFNLQSSKEGNIKKPFFVIIVTSVQEENRLNARKTD